MEQFLRSLIRQLVEGVKEVGIALGTHVWLNRQSREAQEGESKPGEKRKYYDEGVLLAAYADLARELKSFGMPGKKVNRVIAEVAGFFGDPKQSTPKEAETFRLSIAEMAKENIGKAWEQLNLFAQADPAGKKKLAAQIARPSLYVEWLERTYIEAGRVWAMTLRSLSQPLAIRVRTFLRSLGPIEAFQFTHSLGRIENRQERLRLLREVLNPPAGTTSLEMAQARGLIDISQARQFQEWLGGKYHQLQTAWQACLTRWEPAVRGWEGRQTRRYSNPHPLNWVARLLKWAFGL